MFKKITSHPFFTSRFIHDFMKPVVYPICILCLFLLAIYIGSRYYSTNFEKDLDQILNASNNDIATKVKSIIRKIRTHYYVNITSTIVQLVNQFILIVGILIYSFSSIKFIEHSYRFQTLLMTLLFGIGTFLALSIPSLTASASEETYLRYMKKNIVSFFFGKTTPITIVISYALILIQNDSRYKQIYTSQWHRSSLAFVVTYLVARNIYYIYYAVQELKYYNNLASEIENNIDSVHPFIVKLKNLRKIDQLPI